MAGTPCVPDGRQGLSFTSGVQGVQGEAIAAAFDRCGQDMRAVVIAVDVRDQTLRVVFKGIAGIQETPGSVLANIDRCFRASDLAGVRKRTVLRRIFPVAIVGTDVFFFWHS